MTQHYVEPFSPNKPVLVPDLDMPLPDSDSCPYPLQRDEQLLLNGAARHYHSTMLHELGGRQYLMRHGLLDPDLIATFKLGFGDRTLCKKVPDRRSVRGGEVRGTLQRLGLIRESGHELYYGSFIVPIFDAAGHTVDMWGEKVSREQRDDTPMQISLFHPPRGVWNIGGIKGGKEEVILCGGLVDAMTFWVRGFRNVTATLGVRGLTPDHLDAFQNRGVKRVLIAFERTKLGDDEARLVAQALASVDIECRRLDLPGSMDVNTYVRLKYLTKGPLEEMVRNAHEFRQTYESIRGMKCARAVIGSRSKRR